MIGYTTTEATWAGGGRQPMSGLSFGNFHENSRRKKTKTQEQNKQNSRIFPKTRNTGKFLQS